MALRNRELHARNDDDGSHTILVFFRTKQDGDILTGTARRRMQVG